MKCGELEHFAAICGETTKCGELRAANCGCLIDIFKIKVYKDLEFMCFVVDI